MNKWIIAAVLAIAVFTNQGPDAHVTVALKLRLGESAIFVGGDNFFGLALRSEARREMTHVNLLVMSYAVFEDERWPVTVGLFGVVVPL